MHIQCFQIDVRMLSTQIIRTLIVILTLTITSHKTQPVPNILIFFFDFYVK